MAPAAEPPPAGLLLVPAAPSRIAAPLASTSALAAEVIEHEGWLWKVGARLRTFRRRFYFLSTSFLYWYSSRQEGQPRGVLFLEGSTVRAVDDPSYVARG